MAFSQFMSKSAKKLPVTLLCQLCEKDPKIKWKCLECGLMMCHRCREKVHPKFASADNHNIVDVKDLSKTNNVEPLPTLDFTKLKCNVHTEMNCFLFCKQCDELVCSSCLAKNHKKHNLMQIREGYQMKVEKLKSRKKNIDKGLQVLAVGEEKVRKTVSQEQTNYDKVKKEILEQDKVLTDALKKQTKKLLNQLNQKWMDISKAASDEDKKVKETQKSLLQINEEVNNLLESNDIKKFFSVAENLIKSMDRKIKPVNTVFTRVPKFVPGNIFEISSLHGKLENVTIPYNTELQLISQFTTNLDHIQSINICTDGAVWIKDATAHVLQKVMPAEEALNSLANYDLDVKDMTLTPSGVLLFCVSGSSVLKMISPGSYDVKDSQVYNVAPLQPIAIHATRDFKVIVGAKDTGKQASTGTRQVIVMDKTGRQEKVIQFDSNNKPLFTNPICVTSNSRNFIGVVDRVTKDGQGRIVVLGQGGEVKNIYKGHPEVNSDYNPFTPTKITTIQSESLFIVADPYNHTLHTLSSDGEVLTYQNTRKVGIELPMSLSVNSIGQLYIGSASYGDSKAKMYITENFSH